MAEISDDALNDLIEQLKKLTERGIPIGPELKKVLDDHTKGLKDDTKSLDGVRKQLDRYNKEIDRGRLNAKNLTEAISDLQDSMEDLTDDIEKQRVQDKIAALARKATNATINDQLTQGAVNTAKAMGKAALEGGSALARNLTSGASGFKVAGDLMTTGIDLASDGIKGFSNSVSAIGTSMAVASPVPHLKVLGGALAAFGAVVSTVGSAMAELTKAGIGILVVEADKLQKTFQQATSAGAVFAGGMSEFGNAAGKANLTFDQLSQVIAQNSSVFAESGLTVSGAVRRIGDVGKAIRTANLDKNMLNLGYSFEEQAEMSAKVLADMRKIGMQGSDKQVATFTAEYAKNLRIIADITGEDAKKKMEQAQAQAQQYAFRAKIEERAKEVGDPMLWSKVKLGLAKLSEEEQKAAVQSYVLNGAITSTAGNLLGLAGPAADFGKWIDSGATDMREGVRGFYQARDKFIEGTDPMWQAISMGAIAGVSDLSGLAKTVDEYTNAAFTAGTKQLNQAEEDVSKGGKTKDKLTQQFTDIAITAQDMRMQIQDLVLSQGLPRLGEAVKKTVSVINDAIKSIGGGRPGETQRQIPGADAQQQQAINKMALERKIFDSAQAKEWRGKSVEGMGSWEKMKWQAQSGIYGDHGYKQFLQEATEEHLTALTKDFSAAEKAAFTSMVREIAPEKAKALGAKFTIGDDYAGLNVKSPESVAGGASSSELLSLARKVQEMYPSGVFTAFNDTHHQMNAPGSKHTTGNAIDFRLPMDITGDPATGKRIVQAFRDLGFNNVIDEYNNPSPGSTGKHIHAALKDGGITRGPSLAGEAGPEAVIPLPNGRSIPVEMDTSALVEVLRDILDVNKDNRDYLEKLFHASV